MTRKAGILRAADLFCGAGGTSTGAEMSGRVKVVLAINCWPTAIASHKANHPHAMHICRRIELVDPRQDKSLPEFDLLMASPECTHHSIARGGRPIDDQRRATPWDVLNWVSCRRPRWVVLENVREFRDWGPLDARCRPIAKRKGEIFRAWLKSLESLGYQVDVQLLNAADFGAATKRTRLFVIARRGWTRRDIAWPETTHAKAQWKPAWSIIDWSKPCPSIFSRTRPLAEKTLRRIEIGMRKFCGPNAAAAFVVQFNNHCDGKAMPFQYKHVGRNAGQAKSIQDPVPTIVAVAANHAVVVPFLTQFHNGPDGERRNYSLDEPVPCLDTQNRFGLVAPFIVPHFGERDGQEPRTHGLDEPLPTVTGQGAGSLVVPYLLAINHGGDDDRSSSVEDPMRTLTTKTGHSLVIPWLTKYYGTGGVQGAGEPVDTITTRDRFGLAMASLVETMQELHVCDIGFRMLDVDELARAQGFPDGYVLTGTKADRVKQIGNSVSPPVARAICQTIAEAG